MASFGPIEQNYAPVRFSYPALRTVILHFRKKKDPSGEMGLFFFGMVLEIGLEQIKSQHAGGMLLLPVQKLVATMNKSSPISSTKKKDHPLGGLFLSGYEGYVGVFSFKEANLGQLQVGQEGTYGYNYEDGICPTFRKVIVRAHGAADEGNSSTIHQRSNNSLQQQEEFVGGSFVGCFPVLGQQGIDGESQTDHLDDDLQQKGDLKVFAHQAGDHTAEQRNHKVDHKQRDQDVAEEFQRQIHSGQHREQINHHQHDDGPCKVIKEATFRHQDDITLMEHQACKQTEGYPGYGYCNAGKKDKQKGHQCGYQQYDEYSY